MSFDEYKKVIDKISNYTNYLYLHVLGEPLIHPNINEFIDYANKNKININLTSNGYLIDKIKTKNIRQLNISLHSYSEKYNILLDKYLDKIFNKVDELKDMTYISYRIWLKNKNTKDILDKLNKKYSCNLTIDILEKRANIKLEKNIFLSVSKEFIWPSLNNNYYNDNGTCYGLSDHIGILVDGTIIPCCLDSKGIINLGNIFVDNLIDIIESKRFNDMFINFKNNTKCEELCKHCKFL
ncbi:MAG: SPASM domain-containing protein [Bacilli bacterium]|nr:SPASM domain-containing protein [Bacilli bacterium]